jgi:hypothetical protein
MKTPEFLFLCGFLAATGFPAQASSITNSAPITSNLALYLLQSFGPFTNQFRTTDSISYLIRSEPVTNHVFYRVFPVDQAFDFHLFNDAGQEVPKTKRGIAYSKPVRPPRSIVAAANLKGTSSPHMEHLFRPEDRFLMTNGGFSLNDMFVITNKGVYELELRIRIWAQTTNTNGPNYEPWMFSENFVKLLVGGTNAHFDVVTSAPVRVKVIKD